MIPVKLYDWRGGWGRLDLQNRRGVELRAEEQFNRHPRDAVRVTFWGALAMALTGGVGALFGTVV